MRRLRDYETDHGINSHVPESSVCEEDTELLAFRYSKSVRFSWTVTFRRIADKPEDQMAYAKRLSIVFTQTR